MQSALLSPVRRRVQDDVSTTANDVPQPQQVVLITDEVEERAMQMVWIYRSTQYNMPMARRLRQPTPPPITHRAIIDRRGTSRAGRRG